MHCLLRALAGVGSFLILDIHLSRLSTWFARLRAGPRSTGAFGRLPRVKDGLQVLHLVPSLLLHY